MATMILLEKPAAAELARIYRERLMHQAELAAKKELVSMSTAIDAAAAKGNFTVSYRLSGSITRLTGEYYEAAMAIIAADIEAAGYSAIATEKNAVVTGYELSWAEQSNSGSEGDQDGENDPVNPGTDSDPENGNGDNDGNGEGNNDDHGENNELVVEPEPINEPEPIDEPGTPILAEDQDLSHYVEVTPNGNENPAAEGWYEVVDGQIVKSEDTEADITKDYYELSWEPVDPDDLLLN